MGRGDDRRPRNRRWAVFLDRDGVLIEDNGPLDSVTAIRLIPGAPQALRRLAASGAHLIVATNQTVVARGLLSEPAMLAIEAEIERRLESLGAPKLDAFYYCPHHPKATIVAYRVDCACRKPAPGLLFWGRDELRVELPYSFLIGDRLSDIAAGRTAGCRTLLVESGRHADPPIVSSVAPGPLEPDYRCSDLAAAVDWILAQVSPEGDSL